MSEPLNRQQELELIPTSELLTTLMTRFEHALFIGTFHRDGIQIRSQRTVGDVHKASGLALAAAMRLVRGYDDTENPIEPEDL